ncbi:MAG: hypothetical protein IJW13_00675 [Clostridia bacterium]|nr:hypothetical protein [Clostridia bacterium]
MKKLSKIIVLVLVVAAAVNMVACSTYGKLQKAFTEAGYTEQTELDAVTNNIKSELGKSEEDSLAIELHLFTKGLTSALIVEFKATDDMLEFYKNSETAQGLVKDVSENEDAKAFYNSLVEAGYANGNCLVVPISLFYADEIKNIVKNA